jgi:diguanylate cyclase (GGDEF)-like protein/PAS domain S-box-containing protein
VKRTKRAKPAGRRLSAKQVDAAFRRFEKAVENMQLGVTVTDLDGRIVYVNPADAAMHGYSHDDLVGRDVRIFAAPGAGKRMSPVQIAEMRTWRRETVNTRRDGSLFPCQLMSDVVRSSTGEPIGVVTTCEDITLRKAAEEQMARDALYDSLTGLPNRAFLSDLLARAIGRRKRQKDFSFAVLFVDLDRFKVINDSLGHAAGDLLLKEVARRLLECVRPGDVVARLGGDEFCVLLDDVKDPSDTTRVAERIQAALKAPVHLDEREVFTTASIGIAVTNGSVTGVDQILRNADTAMYRAKARGKARFEVFDRGMHERAVALLQLETDLRYALDQGQFRLVYLPVVALETERIMGFEALVRWEHPGHSLVSPAEFLPLAEETGLIVPLGRWVIREACRSMAEWIRTFPDLADLSVSVNLSAKQLHQIDLVDHVANVLRETGLAPSRLKVEISEAVLMGDPDVHVAVVGRLAELGVQVQVDDFGTGSSSLNYLSRFHVDTLKIDRSFVNTLGEHLERSAVVQAIITLARDLNISVVAEGIETTRQSDRLITLHCERGQGYLYSHPVDADQALALLREQRPS